MFEDVCKLVCACRICSCGSEHLCKDAEVLSAGRCIRIVWEIFARTVYSSKHQSQSVSERASLLILSPRSQQYYCIQNAFLFLFKDLFAAWLEQVARCCSLVSWVHAAWDETKSCDGSCGLPTKMQERSVTCQVRQLVQTGKGRGILAYPHNTYCMNIDTINCYFNL